VIRLQQCNRVLRLRGPAFRLRSRHDWVLLVWWRAR